VRFGWMQGFGKVRVSLARHSTALNWLPRKTLCVWSWKLGGLFQRKSSKPLFFLVFLLCLCSWCVIIVYTSKNIVFRETPHKREPKIKEKLAGGVWR